MLLTQAKVGNATGSLFDASDRHFAWVAGYVKKAVPESWLPEKARPLPPPPRHQIAQAYVQRVQDWILKNRAITAAIVAFTGTGGFLLWRERRKYNRKRRARRASNGARREVVGTHWTISMNEACDL